MIDPVQERQDAYLESLEALDAQNRKWIERDYQRRRREQDILAALWAKMQAEADAVNAEAEAIMAERGW
jgi:ABC-type Fe3+/spermidine/putrescine transport system ATPase subunit